MTDYTAYKDKVIVLGNSTNVKNNKYGNAINSFGTVIRTNKYQTTEYREYIGDKTDIWVRANVRSFYRNNNDFWLDHISKINEIIICCAPHVARDEPEEQLEFFKNIYPNNYVDIISYETIDKYYKDAPWPNKMKWPSTGLTAIQYAIERFGKAYIHGFDFFEPWDYSNPGHYYEDKAAGFGKYHIPVLEKYCIKQYIDQGKVEFLDKKEESRLFSVPFEKDELKDRRFLYYRKNQADVISYNIHFLDDGEVEGYRNKNEHCWDYWKGFLFFKNPEGRITSMYRYNKNKKVFIGVHLRSGAKHQLMFKKEAKQKRLSHFYIKDKRNDDVIIIGNSGIVLNNEYGSEIDSFDHVVRLNRFYTFDYDNNKDYKKYVGQKTNTWVRSEYIRFARTEKVWDSELGKIEKILIVAPKHNIKKYSSSLRKMWQKQYPEKEIDVLNLSTIENMHFQMNWEKGKWPSTGLMAMEYFLEKYNRIHIYGFDFFGYAINDLATHYYFNKEVIPDWQRFHIPKKEYEYVKKYADIGRIVFWKDYLDAYNSSA